MTDIDKVMDDLMDIKERNKLSECEMQTIDDAIKLILEKERNDKMFHELEEEWSHGGECSECGYHNSNFNYKYCPMCGAIMDA